MHVLDLPAELNISLVFNVENLSPYRGTFEPLVLSSGPSVGIPIPKTPQFHKPKDEIDNILDDEFLSSTIGGGYRYLVQWKGRAPSDATWMFEEDLHESDPELLDWYLQSHSTESSFFQPGKNDAVPKDFRQTYFRRRIRK